MNHSFYDRNIIKYTFRYLDDSWRNANISGGYKRTAQKILRNENALFSSNLPNNPTFKLLR